jgi:hypothetical protein
MTAWIERVATWRTVAVLFALDLVLLASVNLRSSRSACRT